MPSLTVHEQDKPKSVFSTTNLLKLREVIILQQKHNFDDTFGIMLNILSNNYVLYFVTSKNNMYKKCWLRKTCFFN